MKRLLIEELERRELLAVAPQIAMASTGLTNSSVEDFYKAQVGTEAGGAAGIGMFDNVIGPLSHERPIVTANASPDGPEAGYADATTGVGQMVITTGANTPGIGSFAVPIAGPSRAGGTGNANLSPFAGDTAALDAAIESLFTDPAEDAVAKRGSESKPEKVAEQKTGEKTALESKPSGRRAWNIAPQAPAAEKAAPVGAGAER